MAVDWPTQIEEIHWSLVDYKRVPNTALGSFYADLKIKDFTQDIYHF